MRLHLPLLFLLEFTGSASGLKISPPRRTHTSCTPLKATAGRGGSKVPRKERTSAPDGSKDTREAWRWGGFVRPKVYPASKQSKNKSSSSDAVNNKNGNGGIGAAGSDIGTAMAIVSQTTEVVVATIASTGAANALLTPLYRWSSSRKRVAEAVEAAAAAKRREQQQQRALFEQQQQEDGNITTSPWVAHLRAALPQPVKETYSTVAAVPGQLAKSGEEAAESLSAAKENLAAVAEAVATAPDRARGAATQALETARTAREVIMEAPGRVEE
ncbi:unnamed protein product, partial [Ectocarpus sp. 13 AM-2016]